MDLAVGIEEKNASILDNLIRERVQEVIRAELGLEIHDLGFRRIEIKLLEGVNEEPRQGIRVGADFLAKHLGDLVQSEVAGALDGLRDEQGGDEVAEEVRAADHDGVDVARGGERSLYG